MHTSGQLLNVNSQAIGRLEMQVGQLASVIDEREKGTISGQPITI